jgi:hypothetical protein
MGLCFPIIVSDIKVSSGSSYECATVIYLRGAVNTMRDFSWKYFTMTGDVESYLLYKAIDTQHVGFNGWDEEDEYEEDAGYAAN